MKACRFCGTEVENAKKKCPNCGSADLIRVCENCREHFDGSFCPRCGVKVGQKGSVCPICHTVYFTNACPNCGYTIRNAAASAATRSFADNNANARSAGAQKTSQVSKTQRPKKKKKHRLLWILAIIVIAVIYNSNSKKDSTKVNKTQSTIKIDTRAKEETETVPEEVIPSSIEETSSSSNQNKEKSAASIISTSGSDVISEKVKTTSEEKDLSSPVIEQEVEAATDVMVNNAEKENDLSNTSSDNLEHEYEAPDDVVDDMYQPVTISFHDASELKGRGLVDYSGVEPNYLNAAGYAVVYAEANLEEKQDFSNIPWVVPIYTKTESGWEKCGTIEHKTKIGILSQEIQKQNGREYEGYLEFQELSSGAVAYIDVKNFVTVSYWELDVSKSVDKGYGVAVFRQTSKYAPVDKNGEKVSIAKDAQVLLPARGTYYVSTMDRVDYQIVGIVFVKQNNKTVPQYVFFNKNDLRMVY